MNGITRRRALQIMGAGALIGCGSDDTTTPATTPPPVPGPVDAGGGSAEASDGIDSGPAPIEATPAQMLAEIDTIVVVMMENRSFDHMLGSLKRDTAYASASKVAGLDGTESNPDPAGVAVPVWKMDNFTPADPPHGWDAVHAQWNAGKNDGFVKAHAGADQNDVMGFHDRAQIPFFYWLADNFTVCDRWFASVLGPTWPNRYYLHAGTSGGKQSNQPIFIGAPDTVWDRLKAVGKTGKNYYAGSVGWFAGAFPGKVAGGNSPLAKLEEFFKDAQAGTLPNFAIIDPDFQANDDHPSHSIKLGQVFMASIYKALAASPQWGRTLLVFTYDEHGGFFDHVPPSVAADDRTEFQQHGFRVPALVVGPTVKRGFANNTTFDHSSVAATIASRYGTAALSARASAANDLSSCLDPKLYKAPFAPPPNMPVPTMKLGQALAHGIGHSSQPELERLRAAGAIPPQAIDDRSHEERIGSWLAHAERLGAVRLAR